jgi:hypothetical protein
VFVVGLICQPIHFSITSNLIHKPQANTNPFIIGIRTQNIISDKSLDVCALGLEAVLSGVTLKIKLPVSAGPEN